MGLQLRWQLASSGKKTVAMKTARFIKAVGWGWLALALWLCSGCVNPPGVGLFSSGEIAVHNWNGESPDESEESTPEGWSYKEVDGTSCANGTPVGMGLNYGETKRDVVIYLSGGGACWDSTRCTYLQAAANLDVTYNARQMGAELYPLMEVGFFDRDAVVNPWPDASYAYIPYCTGDLHIGRRMMPYDGFRSGELINHLGGYNLERYLEELGQFFPHAERVWLVGISAGGYGITWNFEHFKNAFPDAEMHVFTDASPWLPISGERWLLWQSNWGVQMPSGCSRCVEEPDFMPEFLAEEHPDTRFATAVYSRDSVLAAYLGVLPRGVEGEVERFVSRRYGHRNTRAFVVDGTEHEVLLGLDRGLRCQDGESLVNFMHRWATGDGWE